MHSNESIKKSRTNQKEKVELADNVEIFLKPFPSEELAIHPKFLKRIESFHKNFYLFLNFCSSKSSYTKNPLNKKHRKEIYAQK